MFQFVLITVIVYLAGCYGYGMYLLWKLYNSRPTMVEEAAAERQERIDAMGKDYIAPSSAKAA